MHKAKSYDIGYSPESVSIQGQLGSFSHETVTRLWPEFNDAAVCCNDSFDEAIGNVGNGVSEVAVIPVENTIAGNVPYVLNLFEQNKLHIIGEFHLSVQFHLLTLSGATAMDVKEVSTHHHAFPQCKGYMDRHPKWRRVPNADTAGAAKMVSEQTDKSKAAIASAFAAHRYGLHIADRHVQDDNDPITRFMVFHRDEIVPNINASDVEGRIPKHRFVSNIYIKPKRNIDRPVSEILKIFERHLGDRAEPMIERYKGKNLRHEGFLAEFMGHYDEEPVKALWDDLEKICPPKNNIDSDSVVGVGCYPVHHYHRFSHRAGFQDRDRTYRYG